MRPLGLLLSAVVPAAIVLSGCGGSQRSADEAFCSRVQALSTTYAAINRGVGNSDSRTASEQTTLASVRFYGGLRALQPSASAGVSVAEWRKVMRAERNDWRSMFFLFYGKEWHRLLRSWHKPLRRPKLPPGTGPTAATIDQAFNSPEGRRFNRLENRLLQGMDAHVRASTRLLQTIGQACASHSGVTIGARLTSTTRP